MVTLLVSLPHIILDAILSFDNCTAVIQLWLSGDKALQYKIATGVTCLKLVDGRAQTRSRWPELIGSLRALRSLSIKKSDRFMPYFARDYGRYIQSLPPSLTTLKLDIKDSICILRPILPSEAESSPNDTPHNNGDKPTNKNGWTFSSAFPHLGTLEISSDRPMSRTDFALLPPSLTHLSVGMLANDVDGAYSSALPRQLLTLKVREPLRRMESSFWAHLPPQLTYLSISGHVNVHTSLILSDFVPLSAKLPRSLTKMKGDLNGLGDFTLETLPPELEFLNLRWLANMNDIYDSTSNPIARYAPKVRQIECYDLSPPVLRALPATITSIKANTIEDHNSLEPSHWPSSLTSLTMDDVNNSFPISSLLPSLGLTYLSLYGFDLHLNMVSQLPRTLLSLSVSDGMLGDFDDKSEISFPPQLKRLYMSHSEEFGRWMILNPREDETSDDLAGEGKNWQQELRFSSPETRAALNGRSVSRCFPYRALPQSLVELNLTSLIPASQLKFLPRRLKSLNIDDIFEDSDYHPSDAIEMEAMRSIFETGSAEGVKESFDWKLLKHTSIATLLPRTLTDISVWGDAMTSNSSHGKIHKTMGADSTSSSRFDWSHLPPQLALVWCRSGSGILGSDFAVMPLKHIRRLTLNLTQVEEHHLLQGSSAKAFFTGSVTIYGDSPKTLTPMVLTHPSVHAFNFKDDRISDLATKLSTMIEQSSNADYLSHLSPNAALIASLCETPTEKIEDGSIKCRYSVY